MFYDHEARRCDVETFATLRQEPRLHSPAAVEEAYSTLERARDLLADLLIMRVQAAAEATGAEVTEQAKTLFRASIEEALDDLYGPVQAKLDRAWREQATDPFAEHRFGHAHYGVGRAA